MIEKRSVELRSEPNETKKSFSISLAMAATFLSVSVSQLFTEQK